MLSTRYEIRFLSSTPTDFECVDVNECGIPEVCHRNSYCTNYPGSYSCSCNTGYVGDGLQCLPLCEAHSTKPCFETVVYKSAPFVAPRCRWDGHGYAGRECPVPKTCEAGSCRCPPSHVDAGVYCVAYADNEVSTSGPDNTTTSEPSGESPPSIGLVSSGSILYANTFTVSCAEINTCHAHAQCTFVATEQRHKCQCSSGYEGDGYECSVIGKHSYRSRYSSFETCAPLFPVQLVSKRAG